MKTSVPKRINNRPHLKSVLFLPLLFLLFFSNFTKAQYCTPSTDYSTKEMAINQVTLSQEFGSKFILINKSSSESKYTNYTLTDKASTLLFGARYGLEIKRDSIKNKANLKVWIDFNRDGDFKDAGELVLHDSGNTKSSLAKSFVVPDLMSSSEGTTRMRVSITFNKDFNETCGVKSGVKNANRVGEFEDYPINLRKESDRPIVYLNGNDTICIEKNSVYTDLGATAMDTTTGDITAKVVANSNVDVTEFGIYQVLYSATDASGNQSDTIKRVVYVVLDLTPPEITLIGDTTIIVNVHGGKYIDSGYTAYDNIDGNLTAAVIVTGNVNTDSIGEYTLSYCVQDANGASPCGINRTCITRKVIVVDTVPPTITNKEMYIGDTNIVQVQLQSVFVDRTKFDDNYDKPVPITKATPGVGAKADIDTRVKGKHLVKYFAKDHSGNETTLCILYIVDDFINPDIDLNTADTVYHPVNEPYYPVSPTVSDSATTSLIYSSNVNPYKIGLYWDSYTARDQAGNQTYKRRYVRVVDTIRPMIIGTKGDSICIGLESQLDLMDYIRLKDNYDSPDSLKKNVQILFNDLNTYLEGNYSAVFVTKDGSGNKSDTFTLVVEVDKNCQKVNHVIELNEHSFSIYPNPGTGLIQLKLEKVNSLDFSIMITNSLGQEVVYIPVKNTKGKQSIELDLSRFPKGLYLVNIVGANIKLSKKLILL